MSELIGFVLPFLIDFINQKVGNGKVRFVVAFLVCAVVGTLFKLNELKMGSVGDVLNTIAVIFAESQLVYKLYWEKSETRATVFPK